MDNSLTCLPLSFLLQIACLRLFLSNSSPKPLASSYYMYRSLWVPLMLPPLLEYMSSHSNTASTFERSSEIISSRKASLISQLEIFFFSLRKTTRAVLHKLYFEYDFFPMWISPEILWKCRLTDGGSENGSWDSAFLTHSPMMLMPLVCQLHTE